MRAGSLETVEAIEKIRAGKKVIITTPTASGKTLAFNLHVFERLYLPRHQEASLHNYRRGSLIRDCHSASKKYSKIRLLTSPHRAPIKREFYDFSLLHLASNLNFQLVTEL